MTYYCHKCASTNLSITPSIPYNLTGTQYQLDKFMKHTAPNTIYQINSVFDDPTYSQYKDFIVTTCNSGGVEVDSFGRYNQIWYASEKTGMTHTSGGFSHPTSGVRVVLYGNEFKIHAFPDGFNPSEKTCCICREPMPFDS